MHYPSPPQGADGKLVEKLGGAAADDDDEDEDEVLWEMTMTLTFRCAQDRVGNLIGTAIGVPVLECKMTPQVE